VLREQITETFGAFGADAQDVIRSLQAQCRLIEWYYHNNQLIQAMTLAREWLIDAVTWRLGQPLDYGRDPRRMMEWAISGLPKVGAPHPDEPRKFGIEDLNEWGRTIYQDWPERETLAKLWTALQDVRNGLDHGEHQKSPLPLGTIQKKADREIMPRLRDLARQWELA